MTYFCYLTLLLFDPECFASLISILITLRNYDLYKQRPYFSQMKLNDIIGVQKI